MSVLGNILAGGRITASLVAGVAPLSAVKSADQPVTSSTVLVNDSALVLPNLNANAVYLILAVLNYTGGAIGSSDFKFQFTGPAGATALFSVQGSTTTAGTPYAGLTRTLALPATMGSNSNILAATCLGTLSMGGTVGSLQMQFAQGTSNATATVSKAGSLLAAWQIQ